MPQTFMLSGSPVDTEERALEEGLEQFKSDSSAKVGEFYCTRAELKNIPRAFAKESNMAVLELNAQLIRLTKKEDKKEKKEEKEEEKKEETPVEKAEAEKEG